MTSQSYNTMKSQEEGLSGVGLVALVLAWAVPGLGHLLLGQKVRGVIFALTIHGLFALGMVIGGIRSINPPEQQIWTYTQFLTGWPMVVANMVERAKTPELREKLDCYSTEGEEWNGKEIPRRPSLDNTSKQGLTERMEYGKAAIARYPLLAYHPKVQDIGAVYCGIAGMLNLLVIFDVLLRVTGSEREVPGKKKTAAAGGGA